MTHDPTPARPCADSRYGARTGTHPALLAYCDRVAEEIDSGTEGIHDRVAAELRALLDTEDMLTDAQRAARDDWYSKHVLFACPEHRFTLLALVWKPGQGTVIHGHTAWGAVGVYEGTPNVAVYACRELDGGRHEAEMTKDIRCKPGDIATVRPGLKDVHRIYNDSDDVVITIHTYGCDLIEDPDAINLDLNLPA